MRLVGDGKPNSLIAADISASLRGLGRGDGTVGGMALMNVTPRGFSTPFDAIVVTPHGVLLISGVELPGPTMRLDAPLYGQWKADNWPLVGSGDAVNPGSPALAASRHLAQRIAHEAGLTVPVATVLAVGPFVDSVAPGQGDLDQPVRVLYPTINGLKNAIAALTPPGPNPCSAEQARAVLRAVDPATPIQPDTTLAKEGFPSAVTTARPPSSGAAPHGQPPAAPPGPTPQAPGAGPRAVPGRPHPTASGPPHQQPSSSPRQRSMLLRPLPIAVVCLLVVGLIAVIAVATAGASDSSPTGSSTPLPDLVIHNVDGLDFHVMAADTDRRCARHTYGDLRSTVAASDCEGVHLGSYLTTVDGRRAAVSMALFEFDSSKQAERIDKLVNTTGTGWALDLATDRDAWPDTSAVGTPSYRSATADTRLRLVRAIWLDESDDGDDTSLTPVVRRAFVVPMPHLR
ncbi:hypothetical protein [Haloechinothrix salitolerans]|uniref:Nuclease-related domain-containing protein n=1 Tax=Haloechinothrix salitolerans TaxID=926830 RepID=A0ABW2C387_9PSEU